MPESSATLGLVVDSSGALVATESLRKLTQTGAQAEQATNRLTTATTQQSAAQRQSADMFVQARREVEATRQRIQAMKEEIERNNAALARHHASTQQVGAAHRAAGVGVNAFREPLTTLTSQLAGADPVMSRIVSLTGSFALGSGMMVGVLAGGAALAAMWRAITSDASAAKKAQEESLAALLEAARVRREGPTGAIDRTIEDQAKRRAELDAELRRSRAAGPEDFTSRAPGNVMRELAEANIALREAQKQRDEILAKNAPTAPSITGSGAGAGATDATRALRITVLDLGKAAEEAKRLQAAIDDLKWKEQFETGENAARRMREEIEKLRVQQEALAKGTQVGLKNFFERNPGAGMLPARDVPIGRSNYLDNAGPLRQGQEALARAVKAADEAVARATERLKAKALAEKLAADAATQHAAAEKAKRDMIIAGLISVGGTVGSGLSSTGHSTSGKVVSGVASVASGAAAGALAGSVVPGLGTAAGAVIGGATAAMNVLVSTIFDSKRATREAAEAEENLAARRMEAKVAADISFQQDTANRREDYKARSAKADEDILRAQGKDKEADAVRRREEKRKLDEKHATEDVLLGATGRGMGTDIWNQAQEAQEKEQRAFTEATKAATNALRGLTGDLNGPQGLRKSLYLWRTQGDQSLWGPPGNPGNDGLPRRGGGGVGTETATVVNNYITIDGLSVPIGSNQTPGQVLDMVVAERNRRARNGSPDPLALAVVR